MTPLGTRSIIEADQAAGILNEDLSSIGTVPIQYILYGFSSACDYHGDVARFKCHPAQY